MMFILSEANLWTTWYSSVAGDSLITEMHHFGSLDKKEIYCFF